MVWAWMHWRYERARAPGCRAAKYGVYGGSCEVLCISPGLLQYPEAQRNYHPEYLITRSIATLGDDLDDLAYKLGGFE